MKNLPKSRLLKIGEASKLLAVSIDTLRRWEKRGWIRAIKTPGGTRFYDLNQIKSINPSLKGGRKPSLAPQLPTLPAPLQTPDILTYAKETKTVGPANLIEELLNRDPKDEVKVVKDEHGRYSQALSQARKHFIVSSALSIILVIPILVVLTTAVVLLSYIIKTDQTKSLLSAKESPLATLLSPFNKLALDSLNTFAPEKALELGLLSTPQIETPIIAFDQSSPLGSVLAESTPSGKFLEINADTKVNGELITSNLRVANNAQIDGQTTLNTVTYSWPNTQGVTSTFLQNNGSGTLAWAAVPTPPTATTTVVGLASFSDSFFSVTTIGAVTIKEGGITTTEIKDGTVANGDLANSKVTITAGTGLSGGGDVSLGSSVTLSSTLGTSIDLTSEVTGVLPIANGGSNKALTLAAGGVLWTDSDSFEVSAAGTSGQVLTSAGTGAPTWTTVSGLGVSWSSLTDPSANLSLAHGTNTTTFASTATTGTFFTMTGNSLTSGKALSLTSSATAFTGELASITLSGNNAANTGSLLALNNTGGTANANTSLYIKHYGDGSGSLAFRIDDVTGDTTPFVVDNAGNVGIGDSSPLASLVVGSGELFQVASTGVTTITPASTGTYLDFDLETEWTTGDLINADWDSATTQTGAVTGMNLDFTNFTSLAGSTTYGLLINDLAAQTTSTEYAIYQEGTNWDYGLYVEDEALFALDVAVNGGDITTTNTTTTVFNTNATTLSLGGAATTALNLGNGSGNYTDISLGSGSGTHVINIAGTGATGADTINIGTGGTGADTITIGNNALSTSLALTSGTGAQTFTSNVATGTTTTSGFVFDATAISSGTGMYLTTDSVTSGRLLDIATTGNTWTGNGTTNGLINLASTSTAGTVSSSSILLNLARSGANANASHTAYGIYSDVTNTGTTNTNIGGYFSATGATTANTAISIGAISTAAATNTGILLSTITGGTTSNYQISTGVLTSATTTTNAQINLGGVVTTGGTTNYGINVGALSGSGTTNYGINIANSTATGTTNYGIKVGTISGAASGTNYGLYVDSISGASTANYAAIFAGGNVGIGITAPAAQLDVLAVAASTGFNLAGTAPASVAGNGTSAATNTLLVVGTAGGASSGTTGQTGGTGGALSLTGGIGGAVAGASGIGGVGGGVTLAGGAGGNGAATGGAGGAFSITAGAAGTGGNANGGTLTLNSGAVTGSGTSTLNLGSSNATTVNLATATSATTLNIGAASTTAVTVAIAGGSGDTGCSVAGDTGNLVCAGTVSSAGAGGAVPINQIAAATGTATRAHANNAIVWNWGTLTTETGMTFGGGTAMTSGSIFTVGGATYVHTALNDVGELMNLSFTDASTNANNGGTTVGLNIASTINTTGAGTKSIKGINIATPTKTACTTGACTWTGLAVEDPGTLANATFYAATFAGGNVGIGDTTPSAALEVGDGTDSLQVSSVGDMTFVDADGTASITGPAGGAFSVVAGAARALTLTGNLGSTWSTSNGVLTVSGDDGLTLTSASTAGIVLNTVDAIANAFDLQQGSDNYINVNTSDGTENIAFGNAVTNPSFSFLGTGAVTIAGSADGTNALTLTVGDIEITNGDFDLVAGDFNVNLDAGDTANFSGTAPASVAGNGTDAGTNTLLVTGTAGGASSGTTGQTGGTGGALSLTGGVGGAVAGASGIGGVGGAVSLTSGAGGNGAATGGAGGGITFTTGNAGTGGNANAGTLSLQVGTITGSGTAAINIGTTSTAKTINLAGTGATGADTINIGTGGTSADTITIGNNASTTSLALTSGTGSQTFTSNVATGTTTTSGFVFDATAISSGTGLYLTTDSVTSGRLLDIATTGNTWTGNSTTSGLVNLASASTAGTASDSDILLNIARSGANSNTAHTAYGLYSTVTNTNVTSGTNIAGYFSATGATTANTAISIGAISTAAATNTGILLSTMTGGTTSNYQISTGVLTSATTTTNAQINLGGVVTTGGTTNYGINVGALSGTGTTNYGINIANSTATGTTNYGIKIGTISGAASGTNYGLYVDTISGASTANYAAVFAGGNVGIGDTTPDALLDLDTADTDGGDFLITNTGIGLSGSVAAISSNATTTGDILTISATALSTGTALTLTGPTSTGVTDHFVKVTADVGASVSLLSLAPDFSGSGVTAYGIKLDSTDSTANANVDYGIFNDLTLSGNAAKQPFAYYGRINSSSTTGDTLKTAYLTTSATGILASGTRTVMGIQTNPASTAASTGGILNMYGFYSNPTSTLSNPGVTDTTANNVYGGYITTTATLASDCTTNCTTNQYGLYVANGTSSTNGTSTKTGLYVESPTGADTNYAAIFAGGNVGIGDTSPSALVEIGDGTDSLQVSSVGDMTFVDADGGASITGPAGGALTISSANSTNLALATTTAGNITLTPAATAGLVNVLTGNLQVGNGAPDVSLNAEDAYIEGTLEVDGAARFDSTSGNAFGGAGLTNVILRITGSLANSYGVYFDPTINPADGTAARAFYLGPTITADVGETHSEGSTMYLLAPAKGGTGTITDFAALRINGAPIGGVNNYGIYMPAGDQPTAVAGATGTAAGSTITALSAIGGNTTIATTGTGGIGGAFSFTAGTGGTAASANTASTGGAGGAYTVLAGTGGAAAATGTNVGGAGGALSLTAGTGGAASGGTGNTGGAGGAIAILAGAAGSGGNANGGTLSLNSGAVTGTGTSTLNLGTSNTTNFEIGDSTVTKTIDIGGITSSAADTINIATNGTAADTLAIGNTNASTTIAITGGNDWSITAAGAATFASTLIASNGFTVTTGTVSITALDSSFIDLSAINGSSTTEGLKLPQATDCTAQTAEGLICWDTDNDILRVGNGATTTAWTASVWSSLTDPTTNLALSHGTNTTTMTTAATTQTFWTMTGTAFTTGEMLDITGTWAPTNGSTNEAIDINITHTPTTLADNFRSIELNTADGTALANTVYGIHNTLALTGNIGKTGIGIYSTTTSSSTTADTVRGADFATSVTGAISTGTRTISGVRGFPVSSAANTGGTTNIYGGVFGSTVSGATTGSTTNAYGAYVQNDTVLTTDGTLNTYGVFVSNTSNMSAVGTTAQYGIYVDTMTGADNNYALVTAGAGNVGIANTTPTQRVTIGNTTSTSTATPEAIDMGGTYSSAAGTNLKLRLYNDGTNIAGFGISSNQMDYAVWGSTANHVFYQGTTELMRIKGDGNVGIGVAPTTRLTVLSADNVSGTNIFQTLANNQTIGVAIGYDSIRMGGSATDSSMTINAKGTGNLILQSVSTGNVVVTTLAAAAATTVCRDASNQLSTCSSSRQFKQNIQYLSDQDYDRFLNDIENTDLATFAYKTDRPDFTRLGIIAEDAPDFLKITDANGNPNIDFYSYNGGYAWAGIKALALRTTKLQQELNSISWLKLNDQGAINTEIKMDKLVINSDLKVGNLVKASDVAIDSSNLNLTGTLASLPKDAENKVSLADAINAINNEQLTMNNEIATNSAQIADLSSQVASQSASLTSTVSTTSSALSSLQSQIDSLLSSITGNGIATSSSTPRNDVIANEVKQSLTPPEELIATDSATLANLKVISEATISGQLLAYGATIQDTFKSLGNTLLGNTTVAGDFSVDGTLSITGSSINSIANTPEVKNCSYTSGVGCGGVLYFQNSPLATGVDFFNGKVTIDKTGLVSTESLALGNQSLGTAIIKVGQTELIINNLSIKPDSKIFLTPTTALTGNLIVEQLIPGISFKVKLTQPNLSDISFNWLIVQSKQAQN